MTAQISDTESDEQFLVELPDVQVVGDIVATMSVTSEPRYVFNNPVVRGSVGATAIGKDKVSRCSLFKESRRNLSLIPSRPCT